MRTEIYRNSILEVWPNLDDAKDEEVINPNLLRVLSLNNKIIVTIDIEEETAQPEFHDRAVIENEILEGNIQLTEYIFPRISLPDHKLTLKDIAIRDKVWGYIEPIVTGGNATDIFKKRLRGIIIDTISKQFNVSKTLIRTNLRRYWQKGMTINALLPNYPNCGNKGEPRDGPGKKLGNPSQEARMDPDLAGIKITHEIKKDQFQKSIDLWYKKRDKKTLFEVYELMLGRFYKAGIDAEEGIVLKPVHERPTYRQFYYWYRNVRDINDEYRKRYGQRKVNLKYRAIEGTFDHQSNGPGSLYQIDATVGNTYLVNRKNRDWIIGRPVIYFVVDVFSRLIAGLYVGLEGPSWIGAALALENAASDKVEYCKKFGINITKEEWPSFGLPEHLTTDRGEYVGNKPSHLIKTLNVKLEHLPAYRPDWKPFVEKQFDVSNEIYVRWIPGAILERMKERGESDVKDKAVLDIHEFETILIEYVRYHNKHYLTSFKRNDAMVADNVEPIPIDLWHWGRKNSLGSLSYVHKDELRMNLLPSRKSRFTASGIKFNGELYTCITAEEESWRFRARNGEKIDVEYSFDPRDTTRIFIRHEDGEFEEGYRLTEQHTKFIARGKEVRWEEQLDVLAYEARMARKGKSENTEMKVNLIDKFKNTVKSAEKSSSSSSGRRNVQKTDINVHRNISRQEERSERKWVLESDIEKQGLNNKVVAFPKSNVQENYVAPMDYTDLILDALEEEE